MEQTTEEDAIWDNISEVVRHKPVIEKRVIFYHYIRKILIETMVKTKNNRIGDNLDSSINRKGELMVERKE